MVRKKVSETEVKKPKAKKPSMELAVELPGAASIEVSLLDQAVEKINNVYRTNALETARGVAECIIDVFFDGKVENFRKRNGTHLSFKELAKREDLQVSYQFVWNACAVVEQLRAFPDEIALALPMSHHKLLLTVKDDKEKVKLAEAAVKKGLSKRQFEERVKVVRENQSAELDSKAGRPPLPAFVKALGGLKKLVTQAQEGEISEDSFEHYSKDDAAKLLDEAEELIDELDAVITKVRGFVGV